MPVRLPPVTDNASRVLLERIIDYAGLFPPASASMPLAVRNYAHYRASGSGWMLSRFVCPVADFDEFSRVADPFLPRDAGAIPWRLSAIGSGDVASDALQIADFNTRHRVCFDECGAIVDVYEAKAATTNDVRTIDGALPRDLQVFIEIPSLDESGAFIDAIAASGRFAKLRTGGITAAQFPPAQSIGRFIARCIQSGVMFKATAGLHHALRGDYRLTYEENSATGRMFGFLNVFLATALLAGGGSEADAEVLLHETDPATIECNDLQIAWRGPDQVHVFDRALLSQVRQRVIASFGSCSFTEPVDEARALGLS